MVLHRQQRPRGHGSFETPSSHGETARMPRPCKAAFSLSSFVVVCRRRRGVNIRMHRHRLKRRKRRRLPEGRSASPSSWTPSREEASPRTRGRPNAVRSETDIVNVAEQRIWQSMEEGQFENLPGKGRPLNLNFNPHADPADDMLFRVLSRNGCAPEWVELNKEIRTKIAAWRTGLRKAWRRRLSETASKWQQETEVLKKQMRTINDMVFRYNLIVPFGRQTFGLS